MLNIPDEVKGLFKLDRCNKNFRVHFPKGEMDDLTNADMVQESVEFSESICSQNTFKFGLSESSTISFETVGVANMMGMKIECGIEIDCTSLGAAWAAGHPVDNTLPFLEPQTVYVESGESSEQSYIGSLISISDGTGGRVTSLSVPITPTQNLNGYSKPWAAGGGVNKFEPMSGVNNGVEFTVQDDGSVKITGTATVASYTFRNQYVDLPYHGISAGDTVVLWSDIYAVVGSYNGSTSLGNKTSSNGNANIYTIPAEATRLRFIEHAKPTPTSAGEVFDTVGHYFFAKSDSFSSWTPYSNICPITGRTGLDVWDDPKYGGTIEWNQLLDGSADANWSVANSTKSFSDGVCTFTASAKDGYVQLNVTRMEKAHVYLAIVDIKEATATDRVALNWYGGEYKYCEPTTNWQKVSAISKRTASNNNFKMRITDRRTSGWDAVQVKNFMLFDLTAMFGSTIADYIYGLEQANAGAGVAWFRNLFPKDYYTYDNSYTETCVSAVNGDPYTKVSVDWTSGAGTVYAGSIEVVSGTLKARPHYASYNGETLVGPWISSMDEYAAGTSPTTGAEVVDLGGAETTYQLTPTPISLLTGQNYLWASNGAVLTAAVFKQLKTLHYRIPYGQFTVRECPRDHQAMTHRKVTAYTDTRLLGTEYQKMLFSSKGFENKYTPKFQNMFYASIGRNNESLILGAGYTKTAHDAFSSLSDSRQDDMLLFTVGNTGKHFKLQVYMKTFTIGGSSQDAYTIDALYGIEGIENVDISNLVEPIAKALVDDYGVSEEDAYNYSTYDIWSRFPNSHPEMYNIATVTKPKVIGFKAQKDLSGGGSVIFNESQYVDLTGMSGLYCINPDREGFITTVSVLAGITLTPWSSDNPVSGHAIGDPVSTYGSGFDEAFLNQYTAPSGSAFDTEMKLEPTGSEKTNVSGAPKRYWFTDAVDISKLMTDYLEVSALFAAQNRTGGLRVFSLDNSVLKEQLSAGEYSEFWWDEYDVSPIGKIKYIHTKKEEEEETTYTFGSGQSVYALTQNEFFKQFKKSQSEIETFLNTSFIPKLGAVAFTPIDLTVGNGIPYIEAGDYVQATSEDGVDAKSFVLTHTISGIQHLTESIESDGGDLMNSVFSEGN